MIVSIAEIISALIIAGILFAAFCFFFDQAVLTRKETVYKVKSHSKKIALTFDDGPSPIWTPKILDELKKAGAKGTFFMIGSHVKQYPEIARRVAEEGHQIGNHGYAHSVLFYYTPEELEEEIKYTEFIIREATGQITDCYRPPKAWISQEEKDKIKAMGYHVVLWSLNSKDWVPFNNNYVIGYMLRAIQSGDIVLFHDSGGVFKVEGGDRSKTVATVSVLIEKLKKRGFEFVTVHELLKDT